MIKLLIWKFNYRALFYPLLILIIKLLARLHHKVSGSLEGKYGALDRWEQQLVHRDIHSSLIWFHVASAGEFLQAEPLYTRFMENGWQGAITFTSINGYQWGKKAKFVRGQNPVVLDYTPFDTSREVKRALALLQPRAIVYVRSDLWPNLIWIAAERKIPQFLVSATLPSNSLRFRSWFGRSFFAQVYPYLQGIYAVSAEDQSRFLRSMSHSHTIQVVGDTRFDSVMERKKRIPSPVVPDFFAQRFTVMIGSCWPPDEEVILPSLLKALDQFGEIQLVIAPHEPTQDHLELIEQRFHAFFPVRWSQKQEKDQTRVWIVDTVGILSSLYEMGNVAYIGGGFTTGVHNIIEPCAMGLPVIFGPKYENSPEAVEMLKEKLAFSIQNTFEFQQTFFELLENRASCEALGKKVQQKIEQQCGASEQCFELMMQEIS